MPRTRFIFVVENKGKHGVVWYVIIKKCFFIFIFKSKKLFFKNKYECLVLFFKNILKIKLKKIKKLRE